MEAVDLVAMIIAKEEEMTAGIKVAQKKLTLLIRQLNI